MNKKRNKLIITDTNELEKSKKTKQRSISSYKKLNITKDC